MEATEEEELIDVMDGATHESCGGEEESSASRAFAVVSPPDEVHASVAAEARLIVVDGATHESVVVRRSLLPFEPLPWCLLLTRYMPQLRPPTTRSCFASSQPASREGPYQLLRGRGSCS
jgi:hypothetical protein